MTDLVLDEQRVAHALRDAWLSRKPVRLTLTERCMVATIVGRVTNVSVTGAHSTVDGWHVPTVEIRGIGKPTIGDLDTYATTMRHMREGVK